MHWAQHRGHLQRKGPSSKKSIHVCVDYLSGPYLCKFLVLWALCVDSFLVWTMFVQTPSLSGSCSGMFLFVWASCVKIRWVSWPKLLPLLWCLDLFLYIVFWSGPSAATFYMFWALSVRFFLCLGLPCVISFFVWALFVYRSMPGGPDTTGLYKKKAQTQTQPTQTRPRTENSMQCPKHKKSTERGPKHKRNLHKQGPEH